MSDLRDKIARALNIADHGPYSPEVPDTYYLPAADAVLAVLDDVRAEAWMEGYIKSCADHGDGGRDHGAQNINPYRKADQ